MELIVNVIIVLVVIVSIFKRIQEVAGKGEELSAPRKVPPEALSEQMERVEDFQRSVQEEQDPGSGEDTGPRVPERVTIEDVFRKFAEQRAPQRLETAPVPVPFHEPEKPVLDDVYDLSSEQHPAIPPPVPRKRIDSRVNIPVRSPLLNFGGPEVVRGVVMSEILGTPVSMREDTKW
jgi:hypothetical protein